MDWISALAGGAHFGLAIAAATLTAGVILSGLVAGFARPVRRVIVDQLITLHVAAVGAAIVLGWLLFFARGLGDPLHAVYAIVALVALPAARILAAPEQPAVAADGATLIDRRTGQWLVVAGLATVGVLVRLAGTG